MPLEGRLTNIVKYHGCSIIIHSDVTSEGRVLGSYEIIAEAPETVAAFAERAITRLFTIVESCDLVGDLCLPDRDLRNRLYSRSPLSRLIQSTGTSGSAANLG